MSNEPPHGHDDRFSKRPVRWAQRALSAASRRRRPGGHPVPARTGPSSPSPRWTGTGTSPTSHSTAARSTSLDGPSNADFDLYVTLDGHTPSTSDYDKRSVAQDSQETVVVEDVDSDIEAGILVDSRGGSGNYTVSVEETGP